MAMSRLNTPQARKLLSSFGGLENDSRQGGDQDQQIIDQLTKIGCEVKVAEHSGHSDIKYRAPSWRDVHVADHAQAEKLMAWLKQNGFEVAPHKH